MSTADDIAPVRGWVLISRDDGWYISWDAIFRTRHEAMRFARESGWPKGCRAIRGRLVADPPSHQTARVG